MNDPKNIYLDAILDAAIDLGIVLTDIDLRIVLCNPAAEHVLGRKEIAGRDIRDLGFEGNMDFGFFEKEIRAGRSKSNHKFILQVRTSSEERSIQVSLSGIWNPGDDLTGFAFMLRDITDHKRAEEKIRYMAYHDSLTGLANRLLLNERLSLELAHAERNQEMLAVMVVDLDQMKKINDDYGYDCGDAFLKSIADRLRNALRKSDTVARTGGDEFMLIVPQVHTAGDAHLIAQNILRSIAAPVEIENESLFVTASIGISLYPFHGADEESLIRTADDAMCKAKELGAYGMRADVSNFYMYPFH
ncbi:MAG: sensor domain-containing diguanylate cyclase [Pseudomonadota bacterium]